MLFIDKQGEAASAALCALNGDDNVSRLESALKRRTGKNAVAVCSADAALHTALFLCGAGRGDYVFVPTFTFYSYIATVDHMGCVPVFLDCDPHTRCVSAAALETAFLWCDLQNKPPKAVVVDNAFGAVADYDVLGAQCKARDVPLVELAVDAFCGEYKGTQCGASGDYGVIGFDKRLQGGGGALLCCAEDAPAAKRFTRAEFSDDENHDYRMHNMIAALDLAQFDVAVKLIKRARKNVDALCAACDAVLRPVDGETCAYALVKAAHKLYDLRAAGFDVKKPPLVHTLPQYSDCAYFEHEQDYSVCRSFDEYCLVGMDINGLQRLRLARAIGNG